MLHGKRVASVRRWTKAAVDCYKRGCICKNCFFHETYFKHYRSGCFMKFTVIELVRVLERPKDNLQFLIEPHHKDKFYTKESYMDRKKEG